MCDADVWLQVTPEVLYCAKKAGVTHVLKAGGAQAVAAMAWGTETCPKVLYHRLWFHSKPNHHACMLVFAAAGLIITLHQSPERFVA